MPAALKKFRQGFTLMELLVVIAIMAIVMAITIPMVTGMMHGNRVKQTENMVGAYLASARATALAKKTPVAVVFFMDHNPKLAGPRAAVQLVQQVPYRANVLEAHFAAIAERPVEYLPEGVEVVTISDFPGQMQSENSFLNCRAVLFGGDGQMLLRNGLVGENGDWKMKGTQPSFINGTSAPGVIVYDASALATLGLTGGAAEDWILKNGSVMLVNAYTGNVIR